MTETNDNTDLYIKTELGKCGKAVSFPDLPDMWQEMQRCYDHKTKNYNNLFKVYKQIKYFKVLSDFPEKGCDNNYQ